ncbi:MAG: aldehyde dehydrogenase family protein [Anaerolineae bacterium]|nr:aldehyde dehydrogenase family protein [Anaerolineae bacterium]
MLTEPILIGGQWRQSAGSMKSFAAVDPSTKTPLAEAYPVSPWEEVEAALAAGAEAAEALRGVPRDDLARFLERFADGIEAHADTVAALAHVETGLAIEPRLRSSELPRTTDQLRQAAAAARERSWCHATIDTKRGLRSMLGPLGGPVVVFGPNNFPLAFNSVAGGDAAAALAAGNPIIAKANTGHPGTTKLLTEAAFEAMQATGMPSGLVQLIYRTSHEAGARLVSHPLVGATGFTGSRGAGLQLKEAADRVGKPIYLEMSSVNPVFVLPGALEERLEAIADELFASCSLGTGQFCTKPGLTVVLASERSEAFLEAIAARFQAPPGVLLGSTGLWTIGDAVRQLRDAGAHLVVGGAEVDGPSYRYANTLLSVSGEQFLAQPEALQTEAFGVVSLMVFAHDVPQMQAIARRLEGNLTASFYTHTDGTDDAIYDGVAPIVRGKVGRLLNDAMPTGVAVSPAMNHGGPFPATGHPGFTAVGIPASILRFGALHSYDRVRSHRLPPELQDRNPTGRMWRLIDGAWTRDDVG